jgi:hypothetical protein
MYPARETEPPGADELSLRRYHASLVQHGFSIIVEKEALESVLDGNHRLNGGALTPGNQQLM